MSLEVKNSVLQTNNIVVKQPESRVTLGTKKSANLTTLMIVVNSKRSHNIAMPTANKAPALLMG